MTTPTHESQIRNDIYLSGRLLCARQGCGMELLRSRDRLSLKIVHPYRSTYPGRIGCIDEGRVFRKDLTFAGWWMTKEEFRERFGF